MISMINFNQINLVYLWEYLSLIWLSRCRMSNIWACLVVQASNGLDSIDLIFTLMDLRKIFWKHLLTKHRLFKRSRMRQCLYGYHLSFRMDLFPKFVLQHFCFISICLKFQEIEQNQVQHGNHLLCLYSILLIVFTQLW